MGSRKLLRWHDTAVKDLESAHGYLLKRNPEAARRFAAAVLKAAQSLQDHPEMGPVARDLRPLGRYRSWIYNRYRLIYRVDEEVIWLLRVWDTRRNPSALLVEDNL